MLVPGTVRMLSECHSIPFEFRSVGTKSVSEPSMFMILHCCQSVVFQSFFYSSRPRDHYVEQYGPTLRKVFNGERAIQQ